MSNPVSPFEINPPSGRRLAGGILAALAAAAVLLLTVVLPAEYGIDPTGLGGAMGLTAIDGPTRTLQVKDVVGGNEAYREVELPDPGDPLPLPNPAVSQVKAEDPQRRMLTVTLESGQETEIKALLEEAQVVLYSWKAEGGEVYVDFHGHEPGGNDFVRYEEQQSTRAGRGSLVAPFTGEHGWFWLNVADGPVTISLEISGYYSDIIDYGILR